jgi:sarcosine oxidase subunit beta
MQEVDCLIIGGGIAGVSTAYHLAAYGDRVTLLERGEIASEASGVNAGQIGALGWGHMPNLQAYLTMGSMELFKALQLDHGYDIAFRQSGALQVIQTEAQYVFTRDHVLALQADGYQVELLNMREARSIEPELNPALLGVMYMPLRGQADPRVATQAFAQAAERHGATIRTGHAVIGLQASSDGTYRVETSHETFVTGKLVLAAGAWCAPVGELLGLRIPIVPVRGQMWDTAPLPPRTFHTFSSAESTMDWRTDAGGDREHPPELTHRQGLRLTRHLYGRQTREGEMRFGGDRELLGYHQTPDPAGIEINYGHAKELLPLLQTVPIRRTWAGTMPFSLDGAPIIGDIPLLPHLYIVSGLASSGFGRGPMAGKLLADYIHTGHRPHVLAASDPSRCVTWMSQHGGERRECGQ